MKKMYDYPKILLTLAVLIGFAQLARGQGNHVFAGSESVNFGVIDLATPGGQTWSTDRSATPGYFSAVGTATFTTPTDAANVNGYVKHYTNAANQGFTFPVGTGADLRTLTTSGTIPANAVIATAWIVGDPSTTNDPTNTGAAGGSHSIGSFGAGILSVSSVGQWDWQDIAANAAGTTVTVSIPAITNPSATAAVLRLVGWNGTQWIAIGTAGATGITEGSTLSGTIPAAGISAIGIGATTNVLPITIASFTAANSNCAANLSWITSQEINAANFEIEQSTNGTTFTKLASVAAKGLSNGASYSYNAAQDQGTAYYRLKLVDKDGTYKYSGIVKTLVNCSGENFFSVYPNPVNNKTSMLTVSYKLTYKGNANIIVTNTIGQKLVVKAISATGVTQTATLPIDTRVATGIYFITIVDANGNRLVETEKIVKQ